MIWIFSDYLGASGGIETYLHALSRHLKAKGIPFRVAVCEMTPCPYVDELVRDGILVYRQKRVPGDRWSIRQRLLSRHVLKRLTTGDWIFCIRQPREEIFETLVNSAHLRGAKVAASWMLTPDTLPIKSKWMESFRRAVRATDAVVSVSRRGAGMYEQFYGYTGKVHVVPYHNLLFFPEPVPLPPGPPWRFGYLGRMDDSHKNLFALVEGFLKAADDDHSITLDLYGGGPDLERLRTFTAEQDERGLVTFHGPYDHRRDLERILRPLHCVVYTSHYEGGPCFSLLEAMQAGRYVLASAVGGIPDLYADHPEAGMLIKSQDPSAVAEGLRAVIGKLKQGDVTTNGPRAVYDDGFTMTCAHDAWKEALGIYASKLSSPPIK